MEWKGMWEGNVLNGRCVLDMHEGVFDMGCGLLCPLAAECVNCLAELKGMSLPRETVKVRQTPLGSQGFSSPLKGIA